MNYLKNKHAFFSHILCEHVFGSIRSFLWTYRGGGERKGTKGREPVGEVLWCNGEDPMIKKYSFDVLRAGKTNPGFATQ